ncbi:universal stress protein [Natrononativus amylolyticus]|uniref:universal stress protein n=1 Tax=Natrononativus amylolyticus TaxID=2963434 RepID=UPI0020CFD9D7|nr:universal stress protein [Natrononativus amylolyticus]
MYTVIVAADTDERRAVAQAEAVASLPGADDEVRVVLLHVFESNPEGASVTQVRAVRRAADALDEAGVDYTLRESSGDPATIILETARELEADLICLCGRKRTPTGKVLFGSVTQSVILSADRPVLTAPVESAE